MSVKGFTDGKTCYTAVHQKKPHRLSVAMPQCIRMSKRFTSTTKLTHCTKSPVCGIEACAHVKHTGVGWPSKSESNLRRLSKSASVNRPASTHAAYNTGAAWPCSHIYPVAETLAKTPSVSFTLP